MKYARKKGEIITVKLNNIKTEVIFFSENESSLTVIEIDNTFSKNNKIKIQK